MPSVTEAVLLVEYEADSQREATTAALELAERLQRWERLALLARVAVEPDDVERLWQVREAALPSLYALRGAAQSLAFVEDIGVPAAALAKFLHAVQDVLHKHETTASFLIHAATGQVHIRPLTCAAGKTWPAFCRWPTICIPLCSRSGARSARSTAPAWHGHRG